MGSLLNKGWQTFSARHFSLVYNIFTENGTFFRKYLWKMGIKSMRYFFTFLLFGTIFPNNLCTGIQYCFKIAAKIIYFFEMDFDSTNSISTQNKNKPLYFSDLLLVLNNVQSLLLYKNTLHRLNI